MLNSTLYETAKSEMKRIIAIFLKINEETYGFNRITIDILDDEDVKKMILAGVNSSLVSSYLSSKKAFFEWDRRKAIPFDIESAVTKGVYDALRIRSNEIYDEIVEITNNFQSWDKDIIHEHAYWLPLLQRISGVFSKSALKNEIGPVSDKMISGPASERLALFLSIRALPNTIRKSNVLRGLEATLEGIVRDLVGKVLLENIIQSALDNKNIPYKTESEYDSLSGVVYDFKADFVIPDEKDTKVFIEVRKSSSKHASLYAKDKMFSAINWKGRKKDLMGVIVVKGPWTTNTLNTMTKVFDYVVPLNRISELTDTIYAYLNGDTSKLKWLIEFQITQA